MPLIPEWRVLVDWNADGDFSDANEDVTADTQALTLDHLRDLQTDYMEAAKLGLVMLNSAHKYTPTNSGGALYGNLVPGRRVWVLCAYPWDGFTGANDASLSARALPKDSNYSWTVASGGWTIQSNEARGDNSATDLAWVELNFPHVFVGCDYTRQTALGGLLLRYVDANNYLYLRVEAAQLDLRKVDAGVDSSLATGAYTWTAAAKHFLHAWLHGNSIRVFVDRTEVIDTSQAFNNTATKFGLYGGYAGGAATRDTMDNWGGWRSLFYGILDRITPRPELGLAYADLAALDDFERFRKVELFTLSSPSVPRRSDQLVGDLLTIGGFSTADRQFGTGQTLANDTVGLKPLTGALLDTLYVAQDEEVGFLQMDGLGFFDLLARDDRASAPYSTSRGTLVGTSGGTLPYYQAPNFSYADGVENVENRIFYSVQRSTATAAAVVWQLSEVPSFTANETKQFLAKVKTYDYVLGWLAPVSGTDWTAHTDAAGTGTDITTEVVPTYVEQGTFNGKHTMVQVVWGTTQGYLTKLSLRATPYNMGSLFWMDAQDATSEGTYGQRKRAIETKFLDRTSVAASAASARLTRRKNPSAAIRLELSNVTKENAFFMVHRPLNYRATVVNTAMGVNADYYIEGYQWSVSKGGFDMKVDYLLRAA